MSRKLVDVVEYLDMVDEIYLEDDGTYFHDVFYKENRGEPSVSVAHPGSEKGNG